MTNGRDPLPEFYTCSDCEMRSSCKTARRCARKNAAAPPPKMLAGDDLEKAARHLCLQRGQDPDATITRLTGVPDAGGLLRQQEVSAKTWALAAEEIQQHQQCRAAIESALGSRA